MTTAATAATTTATTTPTTPTATTASYYRRDLTVWAFRPNASAPNGFTQAGAARVWGGPAAYSGLTKQGDFVIFEGGPAYRYQSVMVARVPVF